MIEEPSTLLLMLVHVIEVQIRYARQSTISFMIQI